MKIGILGGSFDPPHIAHSLISRETKEILGLDEVWLMPCYGHTFMKHLAPVRDRYTMVKYLEEPGIKVSDYEIRTKSEGYTIITLRELYKLQPQDEFYWIMGSDQLEKFHTWGPGWQNIFTDFNLVIFPRETIQTDLFEKTKKSLQVDELPKTVHVLAEKNEILTNISSTMIRKRVSEKKSIQHLVPKEIENYIKEKGLYL